MARIGGGGSDRIWRRRCCATQCRGRQHAGHGHGCQHAGGRDRVLGSAVSVQRERRHHRSERLADHPVASPGKGACSASFSRTSAASLEFPIALRSPTVSRRSIRFGSSRLQTDSSRALEGDATHEDLRLQSRGRTAGGARRQFSTLALIGVVLWGTLVGSVLPFILRRLGFDPATSSAPLYHVLISPRRERSWMPALDRTLKRFFRRFLGRF